MGTQKNENKTCTCVVTPCNFYISVPADAPTDVSVIATSPFTIAINGSPPSTPNGFIVSYTLYISSSSVTTTKNQELLASMLGGFTPYERVSVRVSASTEIGEGPQSEPVIVYTQETSKSHNYTQNRIITRGGRRGLRAIASPLSGKLFI